MNDVVIRDALLNDAEAIAAVQVDSWRTTYAGIVEESFLKEMSLATHRERWDRILAMNADDASRFTFVATIDDRVVGFASGGAAIGDDPPAEGALYALYLLDEFHGRGIGRSLFETFVTAMSRAGYRSLMVWVLDRNRSKEFYRSMGGVEHDSSTIAIGEREYDMVSYLWTSLPSSDSD